MWPRKKMKHRKSLASASSDFVLTMMRLTARESEVELFESLSDFLFHISKTMCGWQKNHPMLRANLRNSPLELEISYWHFFFVVSVVLWLTKQEQEADNLFVDKESTRGLNQQGNPRILQAGLCWVPTGSSALPQINSPGSVTTLGRSWHHWCSWHH